MPTLTKILAVTPKADDEKLSPAFSGGLLSQSGVDVSILVHSQPRTICDNREVSINNCRHELQKAATKEANEYDYILLIDSDVIIANENVLSAMVSAIEQGFKSVHVDTKGIINNHMIAALCLVRPETYLKIDYLYAPFQCQCRKLTSIVGLKNQVYLDPKKYKAFEL